MVDHVTVVPPDSLRATEVCPALLSVNSHQPLMTTPLRAELSRVQKTVE